MRVDGLGRAISGAGAPARQTTAAGVFRIADAASSESPKASAPMRSASGLDALLSLQAVQDLPVERRKRALKRGRGLLDALDELKIALLEGRSDPSALGALRQRVQQRREATDDVGLDDTLAAIDLRVQVELAKRSR